MPFATVRPASGTAASIPVRFPARAHLRTAWSAGRARDQLPRSPQASSDRRPPPRRVGDRIHPAASSPHGTRVLQEPPSDLTSVDPHDGDPARPVPAENPVIFGGRSAAAFPRRIAYHFRWRRACRGAAPPGRRHSILNRASDDRRQAGEPIRPSTRSGWAELKLEAPGCVLLMQVGAFMKGLD